MGTNNLLAVGPDLDNKAFSVIISLAITITDFSLTTHTDTPWTIVGHLRMNAKRREVCKESQAHPFLTT